MTTAEIATTLVAINRMPEHVDRYDELYAPESVSVETFGPAPEEYRGLDAIRKKAADWYADVEEIHSLEVSDALVATDSFVIRYTIDATYKSMGRMNMAELGIYTVAGGKIVREEFRS
jgi:hypothetical protein